MQGRPVKIILAMNAAVAATALAGGLFLGSWRLISAGAGMATVAANLFAMLLIFSSFADNGAPDARHISSVILAGLKFLVLAGVVFVFIGILELDPVMFAAGFAGALAIPCTGVLITSTVRPKRAAAECMKGSTTCRME
jgi:hypothetical protein